MSIAILLLSLIVCSTHAADSHKSILQQAVIARFCNKQHNQLYAVASSEQQDERVVKIWGLHACDNIATIHVPIRPQALLYDHKNKLLYASWPYALQIWLAEGERPEPVPRHEHEKCINDLRTLSVQNMYSWLCCQDNGYITDGQNIFCAFDTVIKAFFVHKQKVVEERRLFGHKDVICNLQKIPSYPVLCSGSCDKTIKLWNMQECFLLATLPCNEIPYCMSVADDAIYAKYPDGGTQMWNIAKFIQASI